MTEAERRSFENRLRERLLKDAHEAKRIGYNPYQFLGLIIDNGPVQACVRVIMAPTIPPGFGRLAELQRLDLTAEATVVDGPWRVLFEREVIDAANKRLTQFERPDLVRP